MDLMYVLKGYKTKINGESTFAEVLSMELERLQDEWAESTFKNCMRDYRIRIMPHFRDEPIKYYTREYCEQVVKKMAEENDYSPGTARHYAYLIRIIFEAAEERGIINDPLWGSSLDQEKKNNLALVVKEAVKKTVRFFTVAQEYQICEMLFKYPKQSGFLMGLLIMWITGARNLEAAAICYENVKIKGGKPCVEIINTYDEDTDRLKPGTKTTNGVRYFIIPWKFYYFIMERKKWLKEMITNKKIVFPKKHEIQSIGAMPIACAGTEYLEFCTPRQLTSAGRKLFKDLGFKKDQMQAIEEDMAMNENSAIFGRFRDPTSYAMRRNVASHLCDVGCSEEQCRYLLGHVIYHKTLKGSHFANDDEIVRMFDKLSKRPFANDVNFGPSEFTMDGSKLTLTNEHHAKVVVRTEGRAGKKLVIKLVPRESFRETTTTLGFVQPNADKTVNGVYRQEGHIETGYFDDAVVPRTMNTIQDYWKMYEAEVKRQNKTKEH